ncbi:single strand DNA binding protein [Arthrobacter phage Mendel]|uniref:SsDNA binding protein n=1 Tax=Arthrobacter phage Mendel TaxID=2484218 RepID=A0A3G3M0J1_9CAUD|nr:single strand DNA binding protein [Arthrobacter phage Mendel]AYQ99920.1 ssDNA binding protein [Arthrobacter phage Mendel]
MSETVSTELSTIENAAPVAGLGSELANLSHGRVNGYSSIVATDFASRLTAITAMQAAVPVADNLGKTINLKDVIIQEVHLVSEQTGELNAVPRITFIDADGTAYSATSDVLYKDLKNFFAILGTPNNWPAPVPVQVVKEKAKVGSYFTLKPAAVK